MKFQAQLLKALAARKLNRTDLARAIGAAKSSTSNWCNGKSVPEREMLEKIAGALSVTPSWLLYGEGDEPSEELPKPPGQDSQDNETEAIVRLEERANRTATPPLMILKSAGAKDLVHSLEIGDTVSIPLVPYDVEPGEPKRIISMVRLPKALITGRTGTIDLEHLELLWVDFSDMHKTMRQGSAALLDKSVKLILRDGIYALQIGRSKTVRRVQQISDGLLRLSSDIEQYSPIDIEESKVAVIGKVIAVIDMKPL